MSLEAILEAAVRAPSGDNCQPWQLNVRDQHIDLLNIPERDTSLFNFRQNASMMAHGALIENVLIASAAEGYRAEVTPFPIASDPNHVATFHLKEAEIEEDPLSPFIVRRQTNRKRYRPVPLTDEQRESILKASNVYPSCMVRLVENEGKEILCDIVGASDRIVFENPHLHRFLFDHIRWSSAEAKRSGDGLDIRTLELALPDRIGFRLLSHWPAARLLKVLGATRAVAKQARELCSSASAVGLIIADGDGREDFLTAGRVFQRAWLETTRLGLAFQPMTGITFLMNRVRAGDSEDLAGDHRRVVEEACGKLSSVLDLGGKTVAMLFRIGVSDPPSCRSLRFPLENVVQVES